ncbi:MAG: hypothetical protein A2Y03_02870 [Omnitrophica WOR_2 bacterium GWF2_38_59]|nr:MAG: hypothetical protein A2Y03_02870 [Omnitrophica WOR_2 bacterium GWF2_38_59]OGX48660.1 MAG: hypothetical protein A2243_09755 [Omnitrophica WOR_2 bacterium RIFOXYA2_FULL_38_17]OGX57222.1 MAG: hypothetical protein A2306_01840 [Omnitrophica WOR_2 bacterium RIFOXYB2_FULL_38_16]
MRPEKLLKGINAKCRQCANECKQFSSIIIVRCPHFLSKVKNKKNSIPFTHGNNTLNESP